MSHYYQTNAITLGRRDVRENDRLYDFYTEQRGKVSALAASAKKVKSHLAGHLEPFGVVKIGVVCGYKKNRITSASVVSRFTAIFGDIDRIFCAGYCLRLADELTQEGVADKKIYELIGSGLKVLKNNAVNGNLKIFNAVFTLKLLSLLGYEPQVQNCVNCKKEFSLKNNFFSFKHGGILCENCSAKTLDGLVVLPNDIKLLRFVLDTDIAEIFKLKAGTDVYKKFNAIVSQFLTYHLH